MRKFLVAALGLTVMAGNAAFAQRTCGTVDRQEALLQNKPKLAAEKASYEARMRAFQQDPAARSQQTLVTIPVVVHVVYKNGTQNVTDAMIQAQITRLNQDFRRTNTDAANTPAAFQGIAADTEIEFCLAQRDPNNLPTTGITRTLTSVTSWGLDDAVKFTSQGGHDAWNTQKYLNLWVCNLGQGLLGYAQFPGASGGPASTDGVVLLYGSLPGGNATPYDQGRTATHEVGHWLGLYHIWGDEPACAADDNVTDTPQQKGENYGCPTYPLTSGAGGRCSATSPSSMFMNYMDYVDDDCMNAFTQGQKTVMQGVLNTDRAQIKTSNGCLPVVLQTLNAAVQMIQSPSSQSCAGPVAPQVQIANLGSAPLTSLTLNMTLNGSPAGTYTWNGTIASLASTTVTLPTITAVSGSNTLVVTSASPNGGTDGDTSNDSQTATFTGLSSSGAMALPFAFGFETAAFPPAGWQLSNPDNNITWTRTTTAAKTGSGSVMIDNANYSASGQIDAFTLPALDLTSMSSPKLAFDVAYRLYTNPTASPNYSDTLQVLVSTDCGSTFTSVYKKFGAALTTATPAFSTVTFVPTASQWRSELVDLTPFAGNTNVLIQFRNITDYENNLFLDNLNVASVTGLNENLALQSAIQVFPNPSSGQLQITLPETARQQNAQVRIMDALGRVVSSQPIAKGGNIAQFDLSIQANGLYVAEVQSGDAIAHVRFLISK